MNVVDPTERGVATLMTRDPVVIDADASVADVAEMLDAYGVSGMPVVDFEGEVVGVISQTDLVRLRGESLPWSAWHGLRARDLMTRPAVTIASGASLAEAARSMPARHVHRLVVVDDSAEPVGVISESDLVREIADACDDG
jgi:CBS domain-containing protein